MSFWELLIRLLPWRPWPAFAALYWHLTRRRVRARNCLIAAISPLPFAYEVWIARTEKQAEQHFEFLASAAKHRFRRTFSVILYGPTASDQDRQRSLQSLEEQIYPNWTVNAGTTAALADNVTAAAGDFIVLLRAGDILAPTTLGRFAQAIESHPDCTVVYGDQDEIEPDGSRKRPWFKPQWNEELFLAQDYLSRTVAIEAAAARRAATAGANIHDLLLSVTSGPDSVVVHVPHILSHVTAKESRDPGERLAAVQRHLSFRNARCSLGPFNTAKIEWPLPATLPLVSIIVPTKDKLELLEPCIEGVLNRTRYESLEILIVDNGSVEGRTLDYFRRIGDESRVRVLKYPGPYNFSAINNFAVQQTNGAYLCLLNNDTDVVGTDWLTEMMRYAVRDDVGAVGAKLLYEDGSIQHAGVAIGIGEAAGHSHRFLPNDEPGYFGMAHAAHFVSAVTAACLVVAKDKYLAVDGLDEENLAVAFNDVDFCLKLQAAGWRNVYVPHAMLLHHESKSRGNDLAPAHVERFYRELKVLQERWGTKTVRDPLHNPNLDRYSETFVLRL